jgi:hypothetical protein
MVAACRNDTAMGANMFERNRVDNPEPSAVAVEVELTDGTALRGKVLVPMGKSLIDVLNGPGGFVDFEPYGDERTLLAKSHLALVKPVTVPRAPNLTARLADPTGFDPYAVLGLSAGADRDAVREAYFRLAKAYHPDRYAAAALPAEVLDYLGAMARRINAAHATLDASHKREAARAPAVYTSPRQ